MKLCWGIWPPKILLVCVLLHEQLGACFSLLLKKTGNDRFLQASNINLKIMSQVREREVSFVGASTNRASMSLQGTKIQRSGQVVSISRRKLLAGVAAGGGALLSFSNNAHADPSRTLTAIFGPGSIGIELEDRPSPNDDFKTVVKRVLPDGQAANRTLLRKGLGVISINGRSVADLGAKEVSKIIQNGQRPLRITFLITQESSMISSEPESLTVLFGPGTLGLELDNNSNPSSEFSTVVKSVFPNSQAETSGIVPGLGVASISGRSVASLKAKEVTKILANGPRPLRVTFVLMGAQTAAQGFAADQEGLNPPNASTESSGQQQQQEKLVVQSLSKPEGQICRLQTRRGDLVEIQYSAWYKSNDGQWIEFDSSFQRGTGLPFSFVLGNGEVVRGLDLALYDMCPGEERAVRVPPGLGYGARGSRALAVPGGAPLGFRVRMVAVNSVRDPGASRGDNFYTGDPCSTESLRAGLESGRCRPEEFFPLPAQLN
mmetsp:Transcript_27222/g.40652  ORF Transcript_27222/g.40652 Transcript_27222/m.40652 type:complete len:490 (+) Transcript_27222:41-1510(+)